MDDVRFQIASPRVFVTAESAQGPKRTSAPFHVAVVGSAPQRSTARRARRHVTPRRAELLATFFVFCAVVPPRVHLSHKTVFRDCTGGRPSCASDARREGLRRRDGREGPGHRKRLRRRNGGLRRARRGGQEVERVGPPTRRSRNGGRRKRRPDDRLQHARTRNFPQAPGTLLEPPRHVRAQKRVFRAQPRGPREQELGDGVDPWRRGRRRR